MRLPYWGRTGGIESTFGLLFEPLFSYFERGHPIVFQRLEERSHEKIEGA
jgi:hypothetical protein